MSKSINIFLGSLGDSLNKHKVNISNIKKEYITNLRIIRTRQYLCAELIKNKLSFNNDVLNNAVMFISLTSIESYRKLNELWNINPDTIQENFINWINSNNIVYDNIHIIKSLINVFYQIKNANLSNIIDSILYDEYSFIEDLENRNRVLMNQINDQIDQINANITINNNVSNQISISGILNKIRIIENAIEQNRIYYNKLDNINTNINGVDVIMNNNTNEVEIIEPTEQPNTVFEIIVSNSFLDKTEIHCPEQTTLHIGNVSLHNTTNNVTTILDSANIKLKGFEVDTEYMNNVTFWNEKIIAGSVPNDLSLTVRCKYEITYNGIYYEYTEQLNQPLIIKK